MKEETQLTVVEQAAVALRLWSNAWREFDKTGKNKPESFEKVIEPFIQMEKEQIKTAYLNGNAFGIDVNNDLSPLHYYNETFKQQEQ
jgi:hypothetical protein